MTTTLRWTIFAAIRISRAFLLCDVAAKKTARNSNCCKYDFLPLLAVKLSRLLDATKKGIQKLSFHLIEKKIYWNDLYGTLMQSIEAKRNFQKEPQEDESLNTATRDKFPTLLHLFQNLTINVFKNTSCKMTHFQRFGVRSLSRSEWS